MLPALCTVYLLSCVWFAPTSLALTAAHTQHRFALFALRHVNVDLFADWKLKSRAWFIIAIAAECISACHALLVFGQKKVAAIKMEIALPAIPSSNLDQNWWRLWASCKCIWCESDWICKLPILSATGWIINACIVLSADTLGNYWLLIKSHLQNVSPFDLRETFAANNHYVQAGNFKLQSPLWSFSIICTLLFILYSCLFFHTHLKKAKFLGKNG